MFLHTVEMRSLRKSHHINSPIKISFFELFLQPNDDIEISFYYKMVNRFHDYYVSAKVIKRQNILYKTTENSSTLSNRLATESHLPIVVGHSRIFIEIKDEIQMQFLVNYVQETIS
jgi:hypothetical protein